MIFRRTLLVAGVAVIVLPRIAGAAEASEVAAPIVALNAALVQAMKEGPKTTFLQRFDLLAPDIDRSFDLPDILRVSVGLIYPNLPDAERETLLTVFRRFTIASYVANFDSFDGERFEVLPGLRTTGRDEVVSTRLIPATGQPIRLDYVMRYTEGGGWRAIDVLLDGTISRVAVQRSDFRALLAQGTAHRLIVTLQKKIVDLSGGQMAS